MGISYNVGVAFGTFCAGCLFGLFPFIVAAVKRKIPVGITLLIACGLVSFLHPAVSIAISVVSGITICFVHKKA